MSAFEEARIAGSMHLRPETPLAIEDGAGTDVGVTLGTLRTMVDMGLSSRSSRDEDPSFSLRPFVVGFCETWLPQRGVRDAVPGALPGVPRRPLREGAPVHRAVPVDVAVDSEAEIFPTSTPGESSSRPKRGACAAASVACRRG